MSFDNWWLNAFWSLAPTVGVGAIFWFVIRAVIHADRTERKAYSKIEQEERKRAAAVSGLAGLAPGPDDTKHKDTR